MGILGFMNSCFMILVLIKYAEGITCLECVYVEGLTDDYCVKPRKNVSDFQVDCTGKYEKEEGNSEKYNFCEIAWGCYKRGYEKRAALHRTCSLGLAYTDTGHDTAHEDEIPCEKIENGETTDGNQIVNLQACFCDKDNCNYPHSTAGESSQARMLKSVCSFSPNGILLNKELIIVVSLIKIVLNFIPT